MVTIKVYSPNVNCDRQHLLKYDELPSIQNVIYTETGQSFNGWNTIILDCSYDVVKRSRLISMLIDGMNNNNEIYCLIKNIVPIRNDKTLITFENDVWMNEKSEIRLGEQNYIYEMSVFDPDYPWKPINARDYYFNRHTVLFQNSISKWYIVILYHNSERNEDMVYYIESDKNACFPFYDWGFMNHMNEINVDTNGIISIYLSPYSFNVNPDANIAPHWKFEFTETGTLYEYTCYSTYFDKFINYNSAYTAKSDSIVVGSTPLYGKCITDMVGSIIWTAPLNYFGTYPIGIYADLSYNSFMWRGYVDHDSIENRFSIECIDIGFFLDYFQQYNNIEKAYNHQVRDAQLEKQLIQNLGNVVSSGINTGVMGALGGIGGLGFAAGATGAAINTAVDYAATSQYNNKLEKIEEHQAKIQYDMLGSNVMSFQKFLYNNSYPAIEDRNIDDASKNSVYNSQYGYYNRITYNCRVKASDLMNIIQVQRPRFISGDFDFIGISEKDALQLNSRFKAGVNFVNWTGAYND